MCALPSGRTAVVTGAGQGLGRAIAAGLAEDGYAVVCVDRDTAAAERVAKEVGGRAFGADVRDEAAAAGLAASLDRCDALVNNAGIWYFTSLADTSIAQAVEVLEVNLVASMTWMKALVPVMGRTGGGAVVNLSSIACRSTATGVGMYPPAKAAVVSLTKMAALEYGPLGVRVNAVGPGMIVTEGTAETFGATPEAQRPRAELIPLGRLGAPEDIAGPVGFLCSPASAYMTGQVLWVDGGFSEAGNDHFRTAKARG